LKPKTISLVEYQKIIPCTKFEHFGIIHFLSYAADNSVKNAHIGPVTLTFDRKTKVIPSTNLKNKSLIWQYLAHNALQTKAFGD